MVLHNHLFVHRQLFFKLLVGLPLLSSPQLRLLQLGLQVLQPSLEVHHHLGKLALLHPANKSFFFFCKSLQRSNSSSPLTLVHCNLPKTLPTLEDSWWLDFTASTKVMVALATLGHSTLMTVWAISLHLVTLPSKDATLFNTSWCLCPFSSKIARLRWRKTLA